MVGPPPVASSTARACTKTSSPSRMSIIATPASAPSAARVRRHVRSRRAPARGTERSGLARSACSAAKRPAPPLPRMRMSVRALLTRGAREPALRSRLEDPEPREVRGAVRALHLAEGLHRALPLPRLELRLGHEQLRIVGALQPALLDALVDERKALGGIALVDVIQADAHEVVAVLGRERFGLVLGAVLLGFGEVPGDEVAQALLAARVGAGAQHARLVALVHDLLRLGGDAGLEGELRHL